MRPPLAGRALLRILVPRRVQEVVAGDLEELWHAGRLTRAAYIVAVIRSALDAFRVEADARGLSRASGSCVLRSAVHTIAYDCRFGVRMMRRHSGVTAAAIVTLAIGIGGSTAIFSTVYPTLFAPLPYPGSDRLLAITDRGQDGVPLDVTFGTYRELRARTRTLDALAVMRPWQPVLVGTTDAERLEGQRVSAAYFQVLGVQPTLGRDLVDDDDRPRAEPVVILSEALWRRRFAADPQVIGRSITLGSTAHVVVGVMPRGFENVLAPDAEIWAALQYDPTLPPDGREWGHHLRLVARLRDGASVAGASADLDEIARTPAAGFPRVAWADMGNGFIVRSLQHAVTQDVRPVLLGFAAAVVLVLTIACVNVTNLLLARAVERQREFAIRSAVGAGRWRLVRQLLIEGMLVALPAGAFGVAAAYSTVDALIALAPPGLPRLNEIAVDGAALGFTLCVTMTVGLAVALLPALQAFRRDLQVTLHRQTRTTTGGHRQARQVLVIAEVALALVLLVSATLLFRSLRALMEVDPGFVAGPVMVASVQTSGVRYRQAEPTHRFFDAVASAVRAIPGVTGVAVTNQLPLGGQSDRFGVITELGGVADDEQDQSAYRYAVTPGYFETMGIPLRRGRTLDAEDRTGRPLVVVISETLARRRFGGIDPLAKRLRIGPADGPWYTVVGIVGDVKQQGLTDTNGEAVYVTPEQWFFADGARWIAVRATATHGMPDAIRNAVRSVDPSQAVVRVSPMRSFLDAATTDRRFALTVFAGFAAIALLLAGTGLYSAVSRSVIERTREIGVRAALGASHREIVGMVLRQGLAITAVGVCIGVIAALLATRMLDALLFGIPRMDPATYAAVVVMFGLVAAAASCIPAIRAVAIDPAITLRAE